METKPLATIDPGIYRHFRGNLYFVLGLSWDANNPLNLEKAEVIYHPLYQAENLGWRRRYIQAFLAEVGRGDYFGPRFVKIMDWRQLNILPGCKFRVRVGKDVYFYVITKVYENQSSVGPEIYVQFQDMAGKDSEMTISEFKTNQNLHFEL